MKRVLTALVACSVLGLCSCSNNNDNIVGKTAYITFNDGTTGNGTITNYDVMSNTVEMEVNGYIVYVDKSRIAIIDDNGVSMYELG